MPDPDPDSTRRPSGLNTAERALLPGVANVMAFLAKHSRIKLHFTPTSASWLNAVETWFSQLERRSIHRGVFTSVADLRKEIKRYIKAHNAESAQPFVWTKSAKAILAAVKRARSSQCDAN